MTLFQSIRIILATLVVLLCSVPAHAVSFSTDEQQRLREGKTIRRPMANSGKQGFYGGSGFTLIDAPVETVWQAILNLPAYPQMFAATTSVTEVSRRGNRSLVHYKMGYRFINLEYYVELNRDPEKHIMSFHLVKDRPHDISMARGYWRLFSQEDGRTLVAYVVSASVPMGVVNLMTAEWHPKIERNLIGAPNDIKKWIFRSAAR